MTESPKGTDLKKEADNPKKKSPITDKTDQPAQEIADDEVEIGETGGKPGEGSRPITERKH
jgi:hypothetical protein